MFNPEAKRRLFYAQDFISLLKPHTLQNIISNPDKYYLDEIQIHHLFWHTHSAPKELVSIFPLLILFFKQQTSFLQYFHTLPGLTKFDKLQMFFDPRIFLFCGLFPSSVYDDLLEFQKNNFHPNSLSSEITQFIRTFDPEHTPRGQYDFSNTLQRPTDRLNHYFDFLISQLILHPNNSLFHKSVTISIPFLFFRLLPSHDSYAILNYIFSLTVVEKQLFLLSLSLSLTSTFITKRLDTHFTSNEPSALVITLHFF